jgi:signal transduction histidine kinase
MAVTPPDSGFSNHNVSHDFLPKPPFDSMTRTTAYWICQLAGWGLWSAFAGGFFILFIDEASVQEASAQGFVLAFLGTAGMGIGVTHAFRYYVKANAWTEYSPRQLVPRVLGAALLLSVAWNLFQIGLAEAGVFPTEAGDASTLTNPALLLPAVAGGSMLMLIWSTIYFGIHYFWNYRLAEIDRLEMQVQSREAKLEAMRLQLNPHFLFNSLNSTRMLIGENPEQARHMITQLARLLRTMLQRSQSVTVALEEELELTHTYLDLEAVRFEERLAYQFDIDPDAKSVVVPPMMVQTLVENAVKHGIATRKDGGSVTVEAEREADTLCVRVTNTGHLDENASGRGIGLRNLRERLRLLYGDAFTFSIANNGSDRVVAAARVPCAPSGDTITVQHL